MKKILFAAVLVAMSCAFVSCDADSIDSGISDAKGTVDSGGPGGGGGVILPPPPPPPHIGG